MLKRHQKIFVALCFMAVLLLTIGPAHAYILRGPHILELMTQKYGKPRSMLVSQKVLFYHAGETGTTEVSETLRYIVPEAFRSDSISENSERIHVMSKGEAMTVIDGKIAVTAETLFDIYKDILLYRSRELLRARLSALGVDMSVVAFGRFQDKIAFVIGAEKPDDPVSQVWIDKDSFLPIRWLMKADGFDAQKMDMEIRYSEWRQIDNAWYPMQIAFYQDEKPVREINVEELRMNLSFPKDLFDIERLKTKYVSAVPEVKDGSVSGEINEIEKSINEFRKKFE
jgi:outer membrane lipoprotein-sorting protein